jgi:spore maturation protein B
MTHLFAMLVPLIFLSSFLFAVYKKVHIYDSFTKGIQQAVPLVLSVFPYVAAVTMLAKLLEISGVGSQLAQWLAPLFDCIGIPNEIAPLILIKPLSGSGSIAVLTEILETYGVDSFAARCACVIYGASETVFYIGAVYFAGIKRKKLNVALGISLLAYLLSVLFACFLCKIL